MQTGSVSGEFSAVVSHVDRPEKEKTVHFVVLFGSEEDMHDEVFCEAIPVEDMLKRWYPNYLYVSGPEFLRALKEGDLPGVKDLATIDMTEYPEGPEGVEDPEGEEDQTEDPEEERGRDLEGKEEESDGQDSEGEESDPEGEEEEGEE